MKVIIISNYAVLLLLMMESLLICFVENRVLRSDGNDISRLMVNGEVAKPKQFSYDVSIQEYNGKFYEHMCAGTLITTQSLLSAAHCVIELDDEIEKLANVEDYIGVLGTVDHTDTSKQVTFKEFRPHVDYEREDVLNDIAILILSKPAELGDFVKTIPLIGPGMSFAKTRATISGWGNTRAGIDEPSRMLRYVDVDIADKKVCEYEYGNLEESQFCYGTERKGTCDGDSGGPIVITIQNIDVQVGVMSFNSKQCADDPSVGTNISSFNKWIRNHVIGEPVFIS